MAYSSGGNPRALWPTDSECPDSRLRVLTKAPAGHRAELWARAVFQPVFSGTLSQAYMLRRIPPAGSERALNRMVHDRPGSSDAFVLFIRLALAGETH